MLVPPEIVVFDVNETLSDMTPMAARFADVGAPEDLAQAWFAGVLRDGFALAATGSTAPFAAVAENNLRSVLQHLPLHDDLDSAVKHIISGFADLDVHPDVVEGVNALRKQGIRLVTLTNGSVEVADRLLGDAGIGDRFERLLSVEDAGIWKPSPGAYAYAAGVCGLPVRQLLLVAVHPWDIHGANRAGLRTAWVNRARDTYPPHFAPPDYTVTSLTELPTALAGNP